ncbi:MAG: CinA family nicotinamide mononucleotide deamidase-related protein [Planctomycetota bacterium]
MSEGQGTAVGVVAVGDELLVGAHPDLNSPYIAQRMIEFGRKVRRVVVVGDDEAAIADAVGGLAETCGLVFVTGGLGPTLDDVTRHGVAAALGVGLVEDAGALQEVREWFERAGREMLESNRRQALVAEGAERVPNAFGTAPGFRATHASGAVVMVLPGPPRELQGVFDAEVAPWLEAHPGDPLHRAVRSAAFADLPESAFAEKAGRWLERGSNPLVGVTVTVGIPTARGVATAPTEEEAVALAEARAADLRALVPERYLAPSVPDLGAFVGGELLRLGIPFTVAESCTGGLVAGALTSAPGVSAVFQRSFVTYADAVKRDTLGVPEAVLLERGAVSAECAAAMAEGALRRAGTRVAVSITGIAGPDGGSDEKPVGLVWFGVAQLGAEEGAAPRVRTIERRWPPMGRTRVRRWATNKALALLLEAARELSGEPGREPTGRSGA